MNFEIKGKLIEKSKVKQISDTFKVREFVIENTETVAGRDFTEMIKFQLVQDKCSLVEDIQKGESIKVNFNIRGRKWEKDGRSGYMTNLDAWRIEKTAATAATSQDAKSENNTSTEPDLEEKEVDDLPF